MRNMSFMLTMQQIRDRTKTVTRRMGWVKLRPGDLVCAVEKGMGLKPGERIKRIRTIRVVNVQREPLNAMLEIPAYGMSESQKEGFGDHRTLQHPSEFVPFFCTSHKGCTPESLVTRIEFEYVED
jgi:hypothetical protein